jgi:tellurite resistance protein TerB
MTSLNKTVTLRRADLAVRSLETPVPSSDVAWRNTGAMTMRTNHQLEAERSRRSKHVAAPKDEPTLRQHDVMDALVAACALVAYADGKADVSERNRLLGLMRRIPVLEGFSRDDLAEEFARQERAFAFDPVHARDRALEAVAALRPNANEARALIRSCEEIVRADGVAHPLENAALRSIITALDH